MNYQAINQALLAGHDVPSGVTKHPEFYKYLLNNRVAYYYVTKLSKNSNAYEEALKQKGTEFNHRFQKTLKLLTEVCAKARIEFLLYKTYRFIDEAYDGDLDVLIKKPDFERFLLEFGKLGFACSVDEPGKGACQKSGFSIIEPHITMSWNDIFVMPEKEVWAEARIVEIAGQKVLHCSWSIELTALLSELFFSPHYLDLYNLAKINRLFALVDIDKFEKSTYNKQLLALFEKEFKRLEKMNYALKMPFFLSPKSISQAASKQKIPYTRRNYLQIANLYWKLRYRFINKLPFTHDWKN